MIYNGMILPKLHMLIIILQLSCLFVIKFTLLLFIPFIQPTHFLFCLPDNIHIKIIYLFLPFYNVC